MKIIWSKLAVTTYNNNLDYLHKKWSLAVVHKFILEVEETMQLIKGDPNIFMWWDAAGTVKIGNINKHISFFYSFDDEEILLHFFWNNHQDPDNLKQYLN